MSCLFSVPRGVTSTVGSLFFLLQSMIDPLLVYQQKFFVQYVCRKTIEKLLEMPNWSLIMSYWTKLYLIWGKLRKAHPTKSGHFAPAYLGGRVIATGISRGISIGKTK